MPFAAFPSVPITTAFGGPDEDPISQGGTFLGPVRTTANTLRLVSKQVRMATTGAGTGEAYFVGAPSIVDTDVFATIATLPTANGDFIELMARVRTPGTAGVDYYAMEYVFHTSAFGDDTIDVYRVIDGTFTLLASLGTFGTLKLAAGDGLGFRVTGSGASVLLQVFRRSGGVWNQFSRDLSDTDPARIVTAGFPGFTLNRTNSPTALTNFGSGATRQDGNSPRLEPVRGQGASW